MARWALIGIPSLQKAYEALCTASPRFAGIMAVYTEEISAHPEILSLDSLSQHFILNAGEEMFWGKSGSEMTVSFEKKEKSMLAEGVGLFVHIVEVQPTEFLVQVEHRDNGLDDDSLGDLSTEGWIPVHSF